MKLYSVTIAGVHPLQCATVSDSKARADDVCEKIKARFPQLRGVTYVETVDSFFPDYMTDCDTAVSEFLKDLA